MGLVDRWATLPPHRRRLLAQALIAVPVAAAFVWSVGPRRARELMPRLPWSLRCGDEPEDVGWAVDAVGRRIPSARCLVRAVAAEAMLSRGGWSPEIHIGARRNASGALAAHAWVEVGSVVVLGGGERDAFARLEPPAGVTT